MQSDDIMSIEYVNEVKETKKKCPAYAASSFALQSQEAERYGYRLGQYIGEGSSSVVRTAQMLPHKLKVPRLAKYAERKGHSQVAIKILDIQHSKKEVLKTYMPRDIQIHQQLPPHDNVVEYLQSFKTDNFYYIVSELCECDLLTKINFGKDHTTHLGLPADVVKRYFRQVCRGVLHLHRHKFAHRDLKLEKFLLDDYDMVKLSDSGSGINVKNIPAMKIVCGSFAYVAPEVLTNKNYDAKLADTWSLGIILYIMVNGKIPFNDDRIPVIEDMMRKQKFSFAWTVSKECRDLIRNILQYDPESRLSIIEIMHHPWLARKRISAKTIISAQALAKAQKGTVEVKFPYIYTDTHDPVPALAKKRPGVATIMVQHAVQETVTLRSRVQGRSNNLVLAMSANIRGGKPPKLNSSRLANIVQKKPEFAPTPSPEDPAEFVLEVPRARGGGAGPTRGVPATEIEVKDPAEMINSDKPVCSNDVRKYPLSIVQRVNSPLKNPEFKSLGGCKTRAYSPSGVNPNPRPPQRATPEDLGPRSPSPRRPDGRLTGRAPLTPTQFQYGHINDIATGQDRSIVTEIWEQDLSPKPQSPQIRMISPQFKSNCNVRDRRCASPGRQLMTNGPVPSHKRPQKLMIGLTSKFRGKPFLVKPSDETTLSHSGVFCVSPTRVSNECTNQATQSRVVAYHPSGPTTPNGYPSPAKAKPTMRWASTVRSTLQPPPDRSTTARPTIPKTRGSPMTSHPPYERPKTVHLSISPSELVTTTERGPAKPTPREIMQGYRIRKASGAKKLVT
ncbi:serine/threonine-protein kinase dst3-like [Lineus longissimus]|uniref:serine/threonine-protein kinase dst3-like n=1 Tax=Lineus longissimus TaxID=88925 RepID=UPI00315CBBCA